MRRSRRLIRHALCLVPWLPAYLAAMMVYAYYTAPRYVRISTFLDSNVDPVVGQQSLSIGDPLASNGWRPALPEHINPRLALLICATVAFVVGYGLLLVGTYQVVRYTDKPPELS